MLLEQQILALEQRLKQSQWLCFGMNWQAFMIHHYNYYFDDNRNSVMCTNYYCKSLKGYSGFKNLYAKAVFFWIEHNA